MEMEMEMELGMGPVYLVDNSVGMKGVSKVSSQFVSLPVSIDEVQAPALGFRI